LGTQIRHSPTRSVRRCAVGPSLPLSENPVLQQLPGLRLEVSGVPPQLPGVRRFLPG
jgi:hypothetical protein